MTSSDSQAGQLLQQALVDSFQQYAASLQGRRIWLACSGGRDSLSLALCCRRLFDTGDLPFLPQLLHVNHGIQTANAVWAQHVQAWAQQQQMPCQILSVQLTANSSEQAARHARYDAMFRMMNHQDVLMLGHHQDDQVETVLMRLFKGAGVQGLGGMQAWTLMQAAVAQPQLSSQPQSAPPQLLPLQQQSLTPELNSKAVVLWRPWLSVNRASISAYAQALALDYIDDPSNFMRMAAGTEAVKVNDRAWLRKVILPLVTQRYPQAQAAIFRSSQLLQAASAIIDKQVAADLASVSANPASTQAITEMQSVLAIPRLHRLSPARQAALIHTWLSPHPTEVPPSKQLVDRVVQLSLRRTHNHQTLLSWYSGVHHYEIRRYQHRLYRLRTEWVHWLQAAPLAQQLSIGLDTLSTDSPRFANNSFVQDSFAQDSFVQDSFAQNSCPTLLNLKPNSLPLQWQLASITALATALQDQIMQDKADPSRRAQVLSLGFAPLPVALKLTLAGRAGRKFGKKLYQAIHEPSFMRKSLLLCSLHSQPAQINTGAHLSLDANPDTKTDANLETNPSTKTATTSSIEQTPLFIVGVLGIYLLHSPFTPSLQKLLSSHLLRTQVVYNSEVYQDAASPHNY